MLLIGLKNDQDFEYLNTRCPASGSDQDLDIDPANHVDVKSLYMPHSIVVHQNKLSYCDSMSFSDITGNEAPIQLPQQVYQILVLDPDFSLEGGELK